MAKWRTVHIDGAEWKWVKSKGRLIVVIKDPIAMALREVPFEHICSMTLDYFGDRQYAITPGKIKEYIEKNLV